MIFEGKPWAMYNMNYAQRQCWINGRERQTQSGMTCRAMQDLEARIQPERQKMQSKQQQQQQQQQTTEDSVVILLHKFDE